jgi:hypothetical protein
VAVVPQISFALDLLTAEKGRTCLFPKWGMLLLY